MALKFALRSTSLDARYATGLKGYGFNSLSLVTSDTDAGTGIFGGKKLNFVNSGAGNKALSYMGGDNMPVASGAFSFLFRIIPGFTGNPVALQSIFETSPSNETANSGIIVALATDGSCRFLIKTDATIDVININTPASTFTFVSGQPTDIWITWDGTTTANAVKFWQAQHGNSPTVVATSTATGAMATRNKYNVMNMVLGASIFGGTNNFYLNEFCIFDTQIAPDSEYGARADFITAAAFEGYVTDSISAGEIKTGVSKIVNGTTVLGTYDGSDRWTDPGVDNVLLATAYKANNTSNNRTGTLRKPATTEVKLDVLFGANDAETGTYVAAERYTDPGISNVRLDTTYKFNSATVNRTGNVRVPAIAKVEFGYAYDASDALVGTLASAAGSTLKRATIFPNSGEIMHFTKGDDVVMSLLTSGGEAAFSLAGATFESKLLNADGTYLTLNNAAHTILNASEGSFTLTITAAQSALLQAGPAMSLLVKVTIGGFVTQFFAKNSLHVREASITFPS